MDIHTDFELHPFAEGRFRYAYKGKWIATAKAGQLCVIKKFKESYTWEKKGWDTTLKIYSRAQEYAQAFGRGLEITDCEIQKVVRCSDETIAKGV